MKIRNRREKCALLLVITILVAMFSCLGIAGANANLKYPVIIINSKATGAGEYSPGESVTIFDGSPSSAGLEIDYWLIAGLENTKYGRNYGNDIVHFAFDMPENPVVFHAYYMDRPSGPYGYQGKRLIPSFNLDLPDTAATAEGSSVTLKVEARTMPDADFTYQWYKGTEAIEGATSGEYIIKNAGKSQSGNYFVLAGYHHNTDFKGRVSYYLISNLCTLTVNPPGGKYSSYYITVVNGKNNTSDGPHAAGRPVSITAADAPAGQVFDTWTTSAGGSFSNAGKAATTFNMPANNVTVTATYKPASGDKQSETPVKPVESVKPVEPVKPVDDSVVQRPETAAAQIVTGENKGFNDVQNNEWYYNDVMYVFGNGLMTGTAEDKFGPDMVLTRGMIVTILNRHAGNANDSGATSIPFTDVPADEYYSGAVKWAAENGIISGYGNGMFGPNDNITREQLAVIMNNYQQFSGFSPDRSFSGKAFVDEKQISNWAVTAVHNLTTQGLISGKPGDLFDPSGNATRAEFASILHRFLTSL